VFTPYHDVRLPKCVPSAMMIHDTCINDLTDVYPLKVRAYYRHMLGVNLVRARHVLTVSEASRACVLARYGLAMERVSVVPNTLEPGFLASSNDEARMAEIRVRQSGGVRLLYTGGSEFRKNVQRLMEAIDLLASRGIDPQLWVTGSCDAGWRAALNGMPDSLRARLHFVGRLGVAELRAHYLAADAVVYPSLCEGFGRACLEAMELGVPIACSDLPVLREVAGDYPVYFDPLDVTAMAEGIAAAATRGRQSPHHDPRFERDAVAQRFVEIMDMILSRELSHA
jgi:glycosyltransferase involved in cell wall biosynthesis